MGQAGGGAEQAEGGAGVPHEAGETQTRPHTLAHAPGRVGLGVEQAGSPVLYKVGLRQWFR